MSVKMVELKCKECGKTSLIPAATPVEERPACFKQRRRQACGGQLQEKP